MKQKVTVFVNGWHMHTESEIEKLAAEYMEEGRTAFFSKELNKAATLTQNAIDIYRMEKNYEQYAFAQNMMGVIYVSLGNESAAMDCYLEVLECSKRHGITSVLALAYNNIGSRYQELRQHQKAIGYFERSADELEKVTSGGGKDILGIMRGEEYIEVSLDPVKSVSGKYMLGVWVRDDLAGVGTLTYYKADGTYAALGHAVSDSDTGTIMSIAEGYLYHTDIVGIKKGKSGTPGELSGIIQYGDSTRIGSIMQNTGLGIHGVLNGNLKWLETGECYEVRYKQDIRTGSAFIVSSVSGESKKYEVMVESVDYSGKEENKGILIRVTDPELLELTGGIVQGMSGSPIIQDGKLIGAVTHVLVNDPTRGYGIFIEKML